MQCGTEWLSVKTECPLCRFDFANEIHEFMQRQSDDIISDVAREAATQDNGNSIVVNEAMRMN